VVIIGNGPDALAMVTAVGNDMRHSDGRWTCGKEDQRVPVGVGTPTVRVDGIVVGGTK
jgi:TldD protein